jgi:hypothetical protein
LAPRYFTQMKFFQFTTNCVVKKRPYVVLRPYFKEPTQLAL